MYHECWGNISKFFVRFNDFFTQIDESTFLGESTYFFVPQPNDKVSEIIHQTKIVCRYSNFVKLSVWASFEDAL